MILIHKQPNTNSPSRRYVQVMDQHLFFYTLHAWNRSNDS